jgi:hypothetical protein
MFLVVVVVVVHYSVFLVRWISLETSGRLMEFDPRNGKLRVLYGDRLVTLLNEVRQLSSLGYTIPPKISQCVDIGKKFYQYGVELQSVRSTCVVVNMCTTVRLTSR